MGNKLQEPAIFFYLKTFPNILCFCCSFFMENENEFRARMIFCCSIFAIVKVKAFLELSRFLNFCVMNLAQEAETHSDLLQSVLNFNSTK